MDLKFWVMLPLAAGLGWKVYNQSRDARIRKEKECEETERSKEGWETATPFRPPSSVPQGLKPTDLNDPSLHLGESGLQHHGEIEMYRRLNASGVHNNFQPLCNSRAANI